MESAISWIPTNVYANIKLSANADHSCVTGSIAFFSGFLLNKLLRPTQFYGSKHKWGHMFFS